MSTEVITPGVVPTPGFLLSKELSSPSSLPQLKLAVEYFTEHPDNMGELTEETVKHALVNYLRTCETNSKLNSIVNQFIKGISNIMHNVEGSSKEQILGNLHEVLINVDTITN